MSVSIVILGMHRSGTSLMGSVLHQLGVSFGNNLMPKSYYNPFGYYEDMSLVTLNNDILETAGGSWYSPPPHGRILELYTQFQSRISDICTSYDDTTFGLKDPRMALTIELYLPFLQNPLFVVCRRDATAVANSLYLRERKSNINLVFEDYSKLNNIYQQRIDFFFESHPELKKIDINYHDIMTNSKPTIDRLITFLGIQIDEACLEAALKKIHNVNDVKKAADKIRVQNFFWKMFFRPWKILYYIQNKFWVLLNRFRFK